MSKRLITVLALALALTGWAGFTTKEMSSTPFYTGHEVTYTGNVEDRVNLWPVAYWREPVGSVAWPIVSFSNDHFALRPLYSQYTSHQEYNVLWPICQLDYFRDDYRVLPFCWGTDYLAIFPEFWWTEDWCTLLPFMLRKDFKEGYVFPLAYWDARDGKSCHWMLPLYIYHRRDGRESFYSVPYAHDEKKGRTRDLALCGLAGRSAATNDVATWAFPLFYDDSEMFLSPLFGKTPEADWITPLYCRTKTALHTAVFSWFDDAEKGTRGFFSLPLLSGAFWSEKTSDSRWLSLLGICGGSSNASGDRRDLWVFPLFAWKSDRAFMTPLYGWRNVGHSARTTNTWWATPLVGTRSGNMSGGWIWPLFDHRKDMSFDAARARYDAGELLPRTNATTFAKHANESTYFIFDDNEYVEESYRYDSPRASKSFHSYDPFLETNVCVMVHRGKTGNRLLLNRTWSHRRYVDLKTGRRTRETEDDSSRLLLGLLYSSELKRDTKTDEDSSRTRVLLKLWDWERKKNDISLDVFPGFTYDEKANGYRKASFLWRLFRCENDPKKGVSADVLFIPISRP